MNSEMRLFRWLLALCAIGLLAAPARAATTLTTVYGFTGPTSETPSGCANPTDGLVLGRDGNFYGTTQHGGTFGQGTVFKVTPSGNATTLHSFDGTDGAFPYIGLTQGSDGNFYGTTNNGGSDYAGTVFDVTPSGTLTTLVNFTNADGADPIGGLIQGRDGNFYGTTQYGGTFYEGTVFKLTPAGRLTTLYSFSALSTSDTNSDGAGPHAALVQGSDGNFYGTTFSGGTSGVGTAFDITPAGRLTTLATFNGANGSHPSAPMIIGADGGYYGTTLQGCTSRITDPLGVGDGTVFKMTPAGALTTLVNFAGINGSMPVGALLQASDGNFYGTTGQGGVSIPNDPSREGYGTVFQATPSGQLTTLYNFTGGDDGYATYSPLVVGDDGSLYGTTYLGGASSGTVIDGAGTIFKISVVPVVLTAIAPATLQAGNLTFSLTVTGAGFAPGATVSWNGALLTTRYVSATELIAAVPASLVAAQGSASVAITLLGSAPSNALPETTTPPLTLTGASPASAKMGSGSISITVTGTNFVNGCVVKWNGLPLLTYYLSSTEATADVPASDLATAGTAKITISNPHVYATAPVPFTVMH